MERDPNSSSGAGSRGGTTATTLHELLQEIRRGFSLYRPVLVEVDRGANRLTDTTMDHTLTLTEPVDWEERTRREYGDRPFIIVGANTAVSDQPVRVGRSRSCDVRVDIDSVSKVHAIFTFNRDDGQVTLADAGSRNGTFINGERIGDTAGAVWSGAFVGFGDSVFVFLDPSTLRKLSRLAP